MGAGVNQIAVPRGCCAAARRCLVFLVVSRTPLNLCLLRTGAGVRLLGILSAGIAETLRLFKSTAFSTWSLREIKAMRDVTWGCVNRS